MNSNENEHYEPVHSAHAIEQVVLFFKIDRFLDDNEFASVRSAAEKFEKELPGRAEMQTFTVNVGFPGQFASQTGQSNGVVMSRTAPNGSLEKELRIERGSLTFRTTIYRRWNTFLSDASIYLSELIPLYALSTTRISSVGLSVVDKFFWAGSPENARPRDLFRENTKYLSPHLLDATDLWHCHTGCFKSIDDNTKRLLNINVDCTDEASFGTKRRSIIIGKAVTDFFNQEGLKETVIEGTDAFGFFAEQMPRLHAEDKSSLVDLISQRMASRIALVDN